ncbi:plasmid partition family protein [Borreliella bavariensis]|nr:plasmid partition family protein [Borreliella bavariensis]
MKDKKLYEFVKQDIKRVNSILKELLQNKKRRFIRYFK